MKRLILFFAMLLAAPANADTFSVVLGGKSLGQMNISQKGRTVTLRSTLNNTPLGVFNGTFVGTSTGNAGDTIFVGHSQSSRKGRVVSVEFAKRRAVRTEIRPESEMTNLSDISRVPPSVIDPVRAIGALITAEKCPDAMRMYDGRRVVIFSPDGNRTEGPTRVCDLTYRVIAGPGHLSPLGIKSAKLQLTYTINSDGQSLEQIKVSSGIFRLSFDRMK